ncbi:hypothetical protein OG264_23755 [Streptomyces xanthophaeus]|uniref:hypothetical protein n=1 Tax=Streptomyces xanthophaeus TaxID=67385 RepID=UPI0038665114|nr:hypothetical protein OG264_23755 [Streptomyces xanthophaeus]WST60776.1 hypothetical protein OG605_14690 [Streptomyces xanthophaeus]
MTSTADGRAPVEPSLSEAGRLLCAGTYLDAAYRDRVIEELYVHEERFVAPSYGFDATRVLSHALRARRAEAAWASAVVGVWGLGLLLTQGLLLYLALPAALLGWAARLRRRTGPARGRRALALVLRTYGYVLLGAAGWGVLVGVLEGRTHAGALQDTLTLLEITATTIEYEPLDLITELPRTGYYAAQGYGWTAVIVFFLLVVVVGLQRGHFARVILKDLSRQAYAAPGADLAGGVRFQAARDRIAATQHAPLILYSIDDPFCGAGRAHRPWQLSVELRPRGDGTPQPLDNLSLVERIRPMLESLRVPSPHGSPEAEAAVLDRLRELVVDECVFLPAAGLRDTRSPDLSAGAFAAHRDAAVEEGGERRRHFLRVRVGGWDENLVVTVFVRVHTQGGMLMVEVAPHVLLPVRPEFQEADDVARRHQRNNPFAKAVWALRNAPRSLGRALATLRGGSSGPWQIATAGHGGALPAGPAVSVRELAAQEGASLFQLMDLDRYLKTVQDRIVGGVTLALHEAGWHTEEFAERAVTVAEGGVFIQSVNHSAFSVGGSGHSNHASHHPSRGSSSDA